MRFAICRNSSPEDAGLPGDKDSTLALPWPWWQFALMGVAVVVLDEPLLRLGAWLAIAATGNDPGPYAPWGPTP